MITSQQSCQLCNDIYHPVKGDVFTTVVEIGAVKVGVSKIGDTTCFSFAGSETGLDWFRDFQAIPVHKDYFGYVHSGFFCDMEEIYGNLRPYMNGAISIQGHSLGAAHAAILAAFCARDAIPVEQLFLFAPPKPGFELLRERVMWHVKEIKAYKNGEDPVPDVPLFIPVIAHWVQVAPLIRLDKGPILGDLNPLGFHSIGLYLAALSE